MKSSTKKSKAIKSKHFDMRATSQSKLKMIDLFTPMPVKTKKRKLDDSVLKDQKLKKTKHHLPQVAAEADSLVNSSKLRKVRIFYNNNILLTNLGGEKPKSERTEGTRKERTGTERAKAERS